MEDVFNTGDIFSLVEDGAGRVWAGLVDGVARFEGDEWTAVAFAETDGLEELIGDERNRWVHAALRASDGSLWFGTSSGLVHFDGAAWTLRRDEEGFDFEQVLALLQDGIGNIWVGHAAGISRFDGETWAYYGGFFDGLPDALVGVLIEDSQGFIWAGFGDESASRFDGEQWTTYELESDNGFVGWDMQLLEDSRGHIWAGTSAGAQRFDGERWEVFTLEDGLGDRLVHALLEDADGHIWAGTNSGGANRFDGERWQAFPRSDGLVHDWVEDVLEDSRGNMWFATLGGVSRYDGEHWTNFRRGDGLSSNTARTLLEDSAGDIWVRTFGGVSRFDGEQWTQYALEDSLSYQPQLTFNTDFEGDHGGALLLEDDAGHIWVVHGRGAGVARFDGEKWTRYTVDDGLASDVVISLFADGAGNVWAGTLGGVNRFDGTGWRSYGEAEGLPNNWSMPVFADSSGAIWSLTLLSGGVNRFDGEEWTVFNIGDGLVTNTVSKIFADAQGQLWFISPGDINAPGGIAVFSGDRFAPNGKILAGPAGRIGVPQPLFEYAGGDRYAPEVPVRFSYATTPLGAPPGPGAWSAWTDRNSVLVEPLPSGAYTFHLRSKDKAGNVDATPATRDFTVDLIAPTVLISAPTSEGIVFGSVEVLGSAFDNSDRPDFSHYVLEYGRGAREKDVAEWFPIVEHSDQPVVDGLLGMWEATNLFGRYVLRLRAEDGFVHGSKYVTRVQVVAASGEIDRQQGGHVGDALGIVDLYIPPGGLSANAQVTIAPIEGDALEPTDDAQVEHTGLAFDLGPTASDTLLRKPATFRLAVGGVQADAPLALFTRVDSNWQRLGGTVEADTLRVALRRLGRVALMADGREEVNKQSIRELAVQPRVLGRGTPFGEEQTTVSFTLGRAAGVRVKVFNAEGRLVRIVAERAMQAGGNAVVWDGRDEDGQRVPSGLYIAAVKTGNRVKTQTVGVLNR